MSDETEESVELDDGAIVTEDQDSETEVDENEDQGEEQDGEASESPPEKPKKGAAARIEELNRNWRETERDRDYWRDMAVRLQGQPPQGENGQQQPAPQAQQSNEPLKSLADFDYDEEKYQAYMVEEVTRRATNAALQQFQTQQNEVQANQRRQTFNQREQEFAKTVDDYGQVTRNPAIFLTSELVDIVQSSEMGPELAYYLGKNSQTTQQLEKLPPIQMAVEVGKIEAKLVASKANRGKGSGAPPPTPKLKGVNQVVDKDPDEMTMDEWVKHRNKELAKKSNNMLF